MAKYIRFGTGPGKNKYISANYVRPFTQLYCKAWVSIYSAIEVWFCAFMSKVNRFRAGHTGHTQWSSRRQMESKAIDSTFHEIKAISWIWHQKWHPIYNEYCSTNEICMCFCIDKQHEHIEVKGVRLWRFWKDSKSWTDSFSLHACV